MLHVAPAVVVVRGKRVGKYLMYRNVGTRKRVPWNVERKNGRVCRGHLDNDAGNVPAPRLEQRWQSRGDGQKQCRVEGASPRRLQPVEAAALQAPCALGRREEEEEVRDGGGEGVVGMEKGSGKALRVAVDVDEVLGRFVYSLNAFCLETYGMEYGVGDYHEYDFAKVWKCSQEESNRKVHEFFTSEHFRGGIEVIPGSYESLCRLQKQCDLMVVTSRQHVIEQHTMEWLQQHFPGIFDAVHFGNHFALEGTSRKKSEICREIGAHVLIDDNPWYALECAMAGIQVLLYDWNLSYPWSKTDGGEGPVHENITRVKDWTQVEQALAVFEHQSRLEQHGGRSLSSR